MKKMQYAVTLLLIGALALSACQPPPAPAGSDGEPVSTQTGGEPAATATSRESGESESGGEEPLQLSDVSAGLASLDSYRATFTMSFEGVDEGGQPQSSSFSSVEEFSRNPPAKRTSFTGSGVDSAGEEGGFELIEVDGKTYSIFGELCTSAEASEAPVADSAFTPSSVIGDITGSQFVGVENVNGVSTRHYIVDVSGLLALGAYTEAKAEAWVADPGGFVVKYAFEASGSDVYFGLGSGVKGSLRWDYEVTHINQSVHIAAPENCGGAPADIPLMPNAADTSSFGELTTYTSASALADVVAFYKAEMAANGWTEDASSGGFATDTFTTLTFNQSGRTASITLTFDPSSNTTTVLIQVSE